MLNECDFREELVGKPFELLSVSEMEEVQGGNWFSDIGESSGACFTVITASSGWCSAGAVVGTVLYSIMKCGG
jgi:type 2 lantibiotic, SP_1948 family